MDRYYKIYGLVIKSEIDLLEAFEVEEQNYEVSVKTGTMPEFIANKIHSGYTSSIDSKKYKWFLFPNEGNFLMENGNSITIELDKNFDPQHIRAIIYGAGLGAIMYQRDILAIHGAGVVLDNKLVIISGISGSGKSTVATEFRREGFQFLADDTVAVVSEEGKIYGYPAYPQQKLCKDAAELLGYDLSKLRILKEDTDKYAVDVKDVFVEDKCEVGIMLCLSTYEGDDLIIEEITGSEKLEAFVDNIYTLRDFQYQGMSPDVFRKCIEIVNGVKIIDVVRPVNRQVASEIVKVIKTYI